MKGLFGDNIHPWIKNFGVFIILILAVLRLIIYPLHKALKDKEAILADQQQTFLMRSRLLEQLHQMEKNNVSEELKQARLALYPREERLPEIQADMLTVLSSIAAKEGVTVSGFETPETAAADKINEVTVVLRFSGNAHACVEMLKSIQTYKKTFLVKTMEISSGAQEINCVMTVSAFRINV